MNSPYQPRCRFCAAALTLSFVDLGMSPPCQSHLTAAQLDDMEPFYPLHAKVCESCFLVQLPQLVAPQALFSEYAYFSSYSKSWVEHARNFADMACSRFGLSPASRVFEVASNDGYLLQHFVARGVPVLGIEPAANVAEAAVSRGVPTTVTFLGKATGEALAREHGRADLVIGNNVLAHVPDINDFVAGLAALLGAGGVLSMEFPHLQRLIEGHQFDTIYHEHFSYLSLGTVGTIFAAHGLRLFDVQELPTHGGSLRVYAQHQASGVWPVAPGVADMLAREEALGLRQASTYRGFAEKVQATKRALLAFLIDARERGCRVAGYGAPGKGNTLLNYCGVRSDLLAFTVDANPYKQGKYTPGTHIPILHPDAIARERPDYVLILPWNLREEIMAEAAYIREWGGRFVVPIPHVQVL